jgi:hypothetical protein
MEELQQSDFPRTLISMLLEHVYTALAKDLVITTARRRVKML